jgi:hypothetical protein
MNRKQYLLVERGDILLDGTHKWHYRAMAEKLLGYKRNSKHVIHHLRNTEEQRNFNDQYYERWGIDFDGKMKYCVLMTLEDHLKIHQNDRNRKGMIPWNKGKKNVISAKAREKMSIAASKRTGRIVSEKTKRKISESQKGKLVSEETKLKIKNSRGFMKTEKFRKIISAANKGKKPWNFGKNIGNWYNNGIECYQLKECPNGWIKGRLPIKWYTNGIVDKKGYACPEGFWGGKTNKQFCSEETRKKMSTSASNRIRKPLSEETKRKISESEKKTKSLKRSILC